MNLAENLSRDFPQVIGENFTNESKETSRSYSSAAT
jgi:hypothetical protein